MDKFLKGEGSICFSDNRFGNIYWDLFEGLFLCCASELDEFFEDVKKYLTVYFDDEKIFDELFFYQKAMVARPGMKEVTFAAEYDWVDYFTKVFNEDVKFPQEKKTGIHISTTSAENWTEYARENVWYGKRNGNTNNKAVTFDV